MRIEYIDPTNIMIGVLDKADYIDYLINDAPFDFRLEDGINDVILHNNKKYKEVRLNIYNDYSNDEIRQYKTNLIQFCFDYTNKYNTEIYMIDAKNIDEIITKIGYYLYKPKKQPFFKPYGIYDKKTDIFFPINNVKSNINSCPEHLSTELSFPISESDLLSRLDEIINREKFRTDKEIIKKFRTQVLTQLHIASINYPEKLLWKDGIISDIFKESNNNSNIFYSSYKSALEYFSKHDLLCLPVPITKDDLELVKKNQEENNYSIHGSKK